MSKSTARVSTLWKSPIADAEGNVCAVANITYYLMKK